MPTCFLETSAPKDEAKEKTFCQEVSPMMSKLMGKPEEYIMTRATSGVTMSFAGSFDPCVNIRICCIGMGDVRNQTAQEVSELVEKVFGVASDRVFIEFHAPEAAMYAFKGKTFA